MMCNGLFDESRASPATRAKYLDEGFRHLRRAWTLPGEPKPRPPWTPVGDWILGNLVAAQTGGQPPIAPHTAAVYRAEHRALLVHLVTAGEIMREAAEEAWRAICQGLAVRAAAPERPARTAAKKCLTIDDATAQAALAALARAAREGDAVAALVGITAYLIKRFAVRPREALGARLEGEDLVFPVSKRRREVIRRVAWLEAGGEDRRRGILAYLDAVDRLRRETSDACLYGRLSSKLARICGDAALPRLCFSVFRHLSIAEFRAAGAMPEDLACALGHSDRRTQGRYGAKAGRVRPRAIPAMRIEAPDAKPRAPSTQPIVAQTGSAASAGIGTGAVDGALDASVVVAPERAAVSSASATTTPIPSTAEAHPSPPSVIDGGPNSASAPDGGARPIESAPPPSSALYSSQPASSPIEGENAHAARGAQSAGAPSPQACNAAGSAGASATPVASPRAVFPDASRAADVPSLRIATDRAARPVGGTIAADGRSPARDATARATSPGTRGAAGSSGSETSSAANGARPGAMQAPGMIPRRPVALPARPASLHTPRPAAPPAPTAGPAAFRTRVGAGAAGAEASIGWRAVPARPTPGPGACLPRAFPVADPTASSAAITRTAADASSPETTSRPAAGRRFADGAPRRAPSDHEGTHEVAQDAHSPPDDEACDDDCAPRFGM